MMNSAVYLFGRLKGDYTQFPNDYANNIFQNFYQQAAAPSQITIHRDGNLMYYGYIRKLDDEAQYIGFCVLLNGIMFSNVKKLFPIFENAFSDIVARGEILHLDDYGNTTTDIVSLAQKQNEVERIARILKNDVDTLEDTAKRLPPVSNEIGANEQKHFSDSEHATLISNASAKYGYTFVTKGKDFDNATLTSYKGIVRKLRHDYDDMVAENKEIEKELKAAQAKQRNTLWVGILSVAVAILGVILYFKVLNPSEVTRYQTGEFIYYGPLKNRKPHGVGLAIYPENDYDGRKYYIGNFDDGERQDDEAVLFYQNGDYFYGSMKGDEWNRGVFFSNSTSSHFEGSFHNNIPYNGTWFTHQKLYDVRDGEELNDTM